MIAGLDHLPDHAWLDAVPMTRPPVAFWRSELMEAKLLEHRFSSEPILRLSITKGPCEHDQIACAECVAVRRLTAVFSRAPHLWSLRDKLIERLRAKVYFPQMFKRCNNRYWPLLLELCESKEAPTHAWLDAKTPFTSHIRVLRTELIACGLLLPTSDHPEVGRFTVWAERFINSLDSINEDDRAIIRRYCRLVSMKFVRHCLNRRSDRGTTVSRTARARLREIGRFAARITVESRNLRTYIDHDLEDLTVFERALLRAFLQWLRRNKISQTSWIPGADDVPRAYRGLGMQALRSTIDRLLHSDDLPLCVRVAGLLSYNGITLRSLMGVKASDLLLCDHLVIDGRPFALHRHLANLVRQLKAELLFATAATRPVGWDPWLFAPAHAIEAPCPLTFNYKLRGAGIRTIAMRHDGIRMQLLHQRNVLLVNGRSDVLEQLLGHRCKHSVRTRPHMPRFWQAINSTRRKKSNVGLAVTSLVGFEPAARDRADYRGHSFSGVASA